MSVLVVTSPALYLGAIALTSPLVFAYAIVFIHPLHILQRASILLLSIAIAAQLQYSVPVFTGNSTYDGVFMSLVWIFHLRAFDLLLWKAVYLPAGTAPKTKQSRPSTSRSGLGRTFTAWCLLFNLRNVNTSWSIKGLPTFSRDHPERAPNKGEFLRGRIAHILITYLALDAIFTSLPAPNPKIDVPEYKQALFSRIGDITLEEIIARPITVLLPAFSIYGIFTVAYNIASVTAVFSGRSEPRNWPPLFGGSEERSTSWESRKLGGYDAAGPQAGRTTKWEKPQADVATKRQRRMDGLQAGKAARWADHKAAGPEAGVAMPWPSRENDHAWKDPQHARQDLQHTWVKHAWKDLQHAWKDLQHAWIDLQIAIRTITIDDLQMVYKYRQPSSEHECLHGPRLENMTALADDLVSSKQRFFPTRNPTSAAPREQQRTYPTVCVAPGWKVARGTASRAKKMEQGEVPWITEGAGALEIEKHGERG
ncbi:hypothetical protein VE04_07834 [Pseudogymnoascus sp. 24MN13]|nr:hypothetical protein VE04_07834 [Pseudogymnoascus sp. 24MN13]